MDVYEVEIAEIGSGERIPSSIDVRVAAGEKHVRLKACIAVSLPNEHIGKHTASYTTDDQFVDVTIIGRKS